MFDFSAYANAQPMASGFTGGAPIGSPSQFPGQFGGGSGMLGGGGMGMWGSGLPLSNWMMGSGLPNWGGAGSMGMPGMYGGAGAPIQGGNSYGSLLALYNMMYGAPGQPGPGWPGGQPGQPGISQGQIGPVPALGGAPTNPWGAFGSGLPVQNPASGLPSQGSQQGAPQTPAGTDFRIRPYLT